MSGRKNAKDDDAIATGRVADMMARIFGASQCHLARLLLVDPANASGDTIV